MNDYKRLTERNSVGLVDTLCKHCMFNGDCTKPRTHCDRAVRERLYELEDKIENGTLIDLPCKVGDTVYEINTILCEYCEHEVGGFSVENGELIILDCIDNRYRVSELCFSKAEAEAKLKELRGEV